jgi:hypothetical protein
MGIQKPGVNSPHAWLPQAIQNSFMHAATSSQLLARQAFRVSGYYSVKYETKFGIRPHFLWFGRCRLRLIIIDLLEIEPFGCCHRATGLARAGIQRGLDIVGGPLAFTHQAQGSCK